MDYINGKNVRIFILVLLDMLTIAVATVGWRPINSLIESEVLFLALASRYLPIIKNEGSITAES